MDDVALKKLKCARTDGSHVKLNLLTEDIELMMEMLVMVHHLHSRALVLDRLNYRDVQRRGVTTGSISLMVSAMYPLNASRGTPDSCCR